MTSVEVTFPDSLLAALRKAPHEVAHEVRVAASIHWYQQGAISMERAAEFWAVPTFLQSSRAGMWTSS